MPERRAKTIISCLNVSKLKDNDYFMIVYRILAYLYGCLKSGQEIREKYLQPGDYPFEISPKYWNYVLTWLDTERDKQLETLKGSTGDFYKGKKKIAARDKKLATTWSEWRDPVLR